ncbi:MAG TPA: RNA methyltransferase, partial [Brevundimonas sp.]|nr:RNA methyltransferase [Brevundimonas sp.]
SMSQNLRVMLGRAAFTEQEVATFRGVITALSRGRGRVLEKLARKAADGA